MVSGEFISFVNSFDLVCLTETFVDGAFEMKLFRNCEPFTAPAKKLSRQGRKSGGVVILLRKCYVQFFKRIDVCLDNFVVLEMAEGFVCHGKPVACFVCLLLHSATGLSSIRSD